MKAWSAVVLFIITIITCTVFLSACQPSIPRGQCSSLADVESKLDFQILFPRNDTHLLSEDYTVRYYYTCIPNPSMESYSKPIIAGYSIDLVADLEETCKFTSIEYRGISVDREAGYWVLFDERNYTCIDKDMVFENGEVIFEYSTYRPYPYTAQEKSEQKEMTAPSIADPVSEAYFNIFYACSICDGIRYSVTYSGLTYFDTIKKECIDDAFRFFKELFTKVM